MLQCESWMIDTRQCWWCSEYRSEYCVVCPPTPVDDDLSSTQACSKHMHYIFSVYVHSSPHEHRVLNAKQTGTKSVVLGRILAMSHLTSTAHMRLWCCSASACCWQLSSDDWRLITEQWFQLDLRSLQYTNRKSYPVSWFVPECCSDDQKCVNLFGTFKLWHSAMWLLPALGFCFCFLFAGACLQQIFVLNTDITYKWNKSAQV